MTADSHVIYHDDLWPRDEENRYRLYLRRGKDELDVVCSSATIDGICAALATQIADNLLAIVKREPGRPPEPLDGTVGILDSVSGRWLVTPFRRGE